jgi:NET1-associated nuclear protein 1 (U3 small nucleolar RNA-associated protein 17)
MVRHLKVPNSDSICAYGLSAAYPTQVYAASSAGPLYHWDWRSGEMIEVSSISPGVSDLSVLPFELNRKKRDLTFTLHSEPTYTMRAYRTPKNSLLESLEEWTILNSKSKLEFFQVANDGKVVAIAAGNFIIIGITETLDAESLKSLTYVWRQVMVSERVHSLTLRVRQLSSAKRGSLWASGIGLDIAIGGGTGVISVFDNVLNNLLDQERAKTRDGKTVVPRRMHWHREPVNTIHWSADGMWDFINMNRCFAY